MKQWIVPGIAAAAAVVAAAVFGWSRTTPPPAIAAGAETVRVTRRDVGSAVKATGVIKPMVGAEVRVGSRTSGVVKRLLVRIGDQVDKGDLLAELDSGELQARRGEAVAALELARATLAYARADLARKQELQAAKLIARSELDLATQATDVAEQQLNQAQAKLEYAQTQLGYVRILAPIAGVVASVSTQEGETVTAGFATPTFVTLLDLSRLEVWAYVDETDIGQIRVGQSARFTVDTYSSHEFEGRVTAIYPQAEIRDNVVNYIAVVRFAPPTEHILRPEMTTTVNIALALREDVPSLPSRAVRHEAGRQFVLRQRGNTVEREWIVTGVRDESYYEIVEGLREGDEVLAGNVMEK